MRLRAHAHYIVVFNKIQSLALSRRRVYIFKRITFLLISKSAEAKKSLAARWRLKNSIKSEVKELPNIYPVVKENEARAFFESLSNKIKVNI